MILRQAPFLAAAFSEIECGVTIADPNLEDTPLIYANAAFERMTGYPRAELLGRNCRFLQGIFRISTVFASFATRLLAVRTVRPW